MFFIICFTNAAVNQIVIFRRIENLVSGKTMIAKRIATILPELSWEESLEITKIYSVLGLVDQEYPLITQRPFRNVHHTITRTALTGGGRIPMP